MEAAFLSKYRKPKVRGEPSGVLTEEQIGYTPERIAAERGK